MFVGIEYLQRPICRHQVGHAGAAHSLAVPVGKEACLQLETICRQKTNGEEPE